MTCNVMNIWPASPSAAWCNSASLDPTNSNPTRAPPKNEFVGVDVIKGRGMLVLGRLLEKHDSSVVLEFDLDYVSIGVVIGPDTRPDPGKAQ